MTPESKIYLILVIVALVCLIVLIFFVVRLVISHTILANNANVIATSVQKEIEPTLKELKEAAKSINSIANSADAKFKDAKMGFASLVGAGACLSGKLKTFVQGISKGISFGINLFKKQ